MAVALHVDAATLVSFVLNRAGRDFSDEEIAAAEDWAIVRVDAGCRVRELSPRAAQMLTGAFPDARPRAGAPLPAPIDAWLKRGARAPAPRLALAPLVLPGRHGSVIVRAMPELASDAAWVLLVRAEAPATVPVAGAVALTGREREVLRWVATGKTDRQIASILGTSSRTVQKHLEHIYVKLSVENRTAAAMRALRLPGSADAPA